MYFLQRRHSPYYAAQLLSPSFAYMLANPEERMRCSPNKRQAACAKARSASSASEEAFSNSYIHVVDENERFLLFTDLPGVKVEDVKVEVTDKSVLRIQAERKKGDESYKFDRQFMIDEQLVDIAKIAASMSDGTLQIAAPKREEAKSRRVAVVGGSPAEEADKDSELSFEVEVPGVKVHVIQVEVEGDGKLVISGERQRAGVTETVHRAFSLNKRVVNTDKLEAFLEDGVLTIRAPKNEPLVGRVIPVTATIEDEAEVDKNEEDNNDEDEETVEEEQVPAAKSDGLDVVEDKPTNSETSTEEEQSVAKSTDTSEDEYEVVPETVTEENE